MADNPTTKNLVEPVAATKSKSDERSGFYRMATLALIIGALHFGQAILVPMALATLLTFALVPAISRLEQLPLGSWRLRRAASVLIVIIVGLSATCTLGWIVERQMAELTAAWPQYRANVYEKSRPLVEWVDRLEGYKNELRQSFSREAPSAAIPGNAVPVAVQVSGESTSLFESATIYVEELIAPFSEAFLVVVILIFMLLSWEDLRDRLLSLLSDSTLKVTKDTLSDAGKRVSRFLATQSIINIAYGAVFALALWIIHITIGGRSTLAFVFAAGFLCGVLRFIPFVGVWIGASVPLAFTFAAYPGNSVFLATLVMFLTLEIITGQLIEPRWLGASTGISATGIMLSAVFWTWLWGPIGLLLSTPLTVLLVVIGKHLPRFRYLCVLLSDRRELDPLPHPKSTSSL